MYICQPCHYYSKQRKKKPVGLSICIYLQKKTSHSTRLKESRCPDIKGYWKWELKWLMSFSSYYGRYYKTANFPYPLSELPKCNWPFPALAHPHPHSFFYFISSSPLLVSPPVNPHQVLYRIPNHAWPKQPLMRSAYTPWLGPRPWNIHSVPYTAGRPTVSHRRKVGWLGSLSKK